MSARRPLDVHWMSTGHDYQWHLPAEIQALWTMEFKRNHIHRLIPEELMTFKLIISDSKIMRKKVRMVGPCMRPRQEIHNLDEKCVQGFPKKMVSFSKLENIPDLLK